MLDFFKHIFQFFFCPDTFVKSSLKRIPNPHPTLPQQFKESVEKLRSHIFRAFRFVVLTILFTVAAYAVTLLLGVHTPHWVLIILRVSGYCLILWSILSYLGYPIRTFDGETLPEIFDEAWHRFLYGGGLSLLLFSYLSELSPSASYSTELAQSGSPVFLDFVNFLRTTAENFPNLVRNINWQFVTGISTALIAYFAYEINRDSNKPEVGLFYDNDKKQLTLKNFGNLPARDVFLVHRQIELSSPVKISDFGRSGGDYVFGKEEIGMSPMSVADLTTHSQFLVCVWRYRYRRKTITRDRVFVRLPGFPNWVTTIETFVSKNDWKHVKNQLIEIHEKFDGISKVIRD